MTDMNNDWLAQFIGLQSGLCTCGVAPGHDHAFGCAITQSMLSRGQTVTVSDRMMDAAMAEAMKQPGAIEWTPARFYTLPEAMGNAAITTAPGDPEALYMSAGPCKLGAFDDGSPAGDPERAAAFWTITTSVRDLSQSSRRLFWSELAALVEREWDCPPGYDRTAWAMEQATAGMVDAAYQRVVG